MDEKDLALYLNQGKIGSDMEDPELDQPMKDVDKPLIGVYEQPVPLLWNQLSPGLCKQLQPELQPYWQEDQNGFCRPVKRKLPWSQEEEEESELELIICPKCGEHIRRLKEEESDLELESEDEYLSDVSM